MKILIPIIFLFTTNNLLSQEVKYVYFDPLAYSGYESFFIKKDSFKYELSVGLLSGETTGTIEHKDDTLILNSQIQPFESIKKAFNPNHKDRLTLVLQNSSQIDELNFSTGPIINFILYDKNDVLLTESVIDSIIIKEEIDTLNDSKVYYFNTNILKNNNQLKLRIWSTNLEYKLDFILNKTNHIEIILNDMELNGYYSFFTNQKAVYTKNGFALIIDGILEQTHFLYERKKSIRVSKKTIVKEYKTAPNTK